MTLSINHTNKKSAGFTLVEMAVILLVMGLVIGSVFSFINVRDGQNRITLTMERQKRVAAAMAKYALVHGILPCPARPEAASPGTEPATCASEILRNGVVPFRVLGISQADSTDGFGNPFTYAVSQLAHSPLSPEEVHSKCRTAAWINGPANYNPRKAVFCCQRASALTTLALGTAAIVYSPSTLISTQGVFGFATAAAPSNVGPVVETPELLTYVAYVLVSHGQNGYRSYVWGNAARRSSGGSNDEFENAEDGRGFVVKPFNLTNAGYFDDIILYRTQEQVVAEFGTDSCAAP